MLKQFCPPDKGGTEGGFCSLHYRRDRFVTCPDPIVGCASRNGRIIDASLHRDYEQQSVLPPPYQEGQSGFCSTHIQKRTPHKGVPTQSIVHALPRPRHMPKHHTRPKQPNYQQYSELPISDGDITPYEQSTYQRIDQHPGQTYSYD